MAESYDEHVNELHSRYTIPDKVLDEILREIATRDVISKRRVIGGEANEVYDVAFSGGVQVIVRVSRDEDKNFEQERWAIAECRQRGVPVPEILGIWHLSTPRHPLDVCVQRKVDGELLTACKLSSNRQRQIVAQAGEFLSRVHDVPVKGFGYINGNGEGEYSTPERALNAFRAMESEFLKLAERVDVSVRDMRRVLRLIDEDERQAPHSDPCLTHNDFCAKHIMVSKASVSGFIDFGEVAGSEPISDFVRWDYYDAERFPLEWLMEGYTNKAVFDDDFDRRLHLKRIAFSLWVMRWYDMQGYAQGVTDACAKLLADLAELH
jgi:aminoglycoside phosphotransferase (APT) family kinase protein